MLVLLLVNFPHACCGRCTNRAAHVPSTLLVSIQLSCGGHNTWKDVRVGPHVPNGKNKDAIKVIRNTKEGQKSISIAYSALLKGKKLEQNIRLEWNGQKGTT